MWETRVIGLTFEDPTQLLAHPNNPRVHPGHQREAVRASLDEIGWVDAVIVNDTTGFTVDGHARVEEAITEGASSIPVLHVELTPEEEDLMLATFDPITNMARYDKNRLDDLLATTQTDNARLDALLDGLRNNAPTTPEDRPLPPTFDDPTEYRTLSLTLTRDRYDDIRSILDRQAGTSDAEKLWNLCITAGVTTT